VNGAREPSIVVNGAITHDFEILGLVGTIRIRLVESVSHAHAFDWRLDDPVDALWLGQTGDFEHGRSDVNDVVPLRTNLDWRL
jgi:hypothetical protein